MSSSFLSKPASSLSFDEYIKLLPHDLVFQKLVKGSSLSRKVLSSSKVQEITDTICNPDELIRRFKGLSDSAKINCALTYLFESKGLPAGPDIDFNDELLSSFLVYISQDTEHNSFYYGFHEFADILSDEIASILTASAQISDNSSKEQFSSKAVWHCLNDFIIICIFASKDLLKKTKNGTFLKASQSSLDKLLNGLPNLTENDIDQTISLLVGYGIDRGILVFFNSSYSVIDSQLQKWLSQSLFDLHNDFTTYCFDHSAHQSIMNKLCLRPNNPVLSIGAFPDSEPSDYLRESVSLLAYCNFLATANSNGNLLFTRAETSDATLKQATDNVNPGDIIIMPDFTVIISGEISPRFLYEFSLIGNITSLDKIYKGKIDKKIINNSLASGIADAFIIEFLFKWNTPPNVLETVKEWIREFTRLSITSGSIVAIRENKISDQITSLESVSEYLEPVEARKVFKIKSGYEDIIYNRLMELGFDPRIPSKPPVPKFSKSFFDHNFQPTRKPVTKFVERTQKKTNTKEVKIGKYGSGLKKLDINELIHVVDYALLMGYNLIIKYGGSRNLAKNTYTFLPISCNRTVEEPYIEGELIESKSKRKFFIDKIIKVGVKES